MIYGKVDGSYVYRYKYRKAERKNFKSKIHTHRKKVIRCIIILAIFSSKFEFFQDKIFLKIAVLAE